MDLSLRGEIVSHPSIWVYTRLAKREEAMALAEFGDEYRQYQAITPAWIPTWKTAKELHAPH